VIPEILRHVVTHLLTRAYEGRVQRDALGPVAKDAGQDVWRLAFSRWYRVVWVLMTLLWVAAVALLAWLWTEGALKWPLLAAAPIFPGLLAFSIVTAWDALTQEIEISGWGLTERRAGVVVATFPWSDVARIAFVVYLDAYRVIPRQGQPVRISMHVQGIPRFKSMAARYVPGPALESVRARISELDRP
jgi:hypothetical protein